LSDDAGPREEARALIDRLDVAALPEALGYLRALSEAAADARGLLATLRLRSMEKGGGRCAMEVEASPHLINPNGVLHGAVLFAALDTAMGGAVTTLLTEGETCATVEAKINYLAPVTRGRLRAEATVVQKGGRVAVAEARATTDDGRLAGMMVGTFIVLRPAGGAG